ncbi:tyrosine-type recombinase/integrase [Saccharothrix obliqua]|uniref:tyrosine-type recombinase/integrase n=1 Tax=Saccharothrix obliqua TaxID=2861747 RepID=UPI001C5D2D5D|nr:site-specific integrase [Saccharothrix obliqua]MBW4719806.1 site-specific integrase [Saccharothrix obliqua]
MMLIDFEPRGWEAWSVDRKPLIRDGMPVLIDDDLQFEDGLGAPRPTVVANKWLRELPVNGAPARRTWRVYGQVLLAWLSFLDSAGVNPFGQREELRAALSAYAGRRLSGPLDVRLDVATWGLHMTALSRFYGWAVEEGHCQAVPFTYARAWRMVDGVVLEYERNLAKLRPAKRHSTIKYLEQDFADLFLKALAGSLPDGSPDESYRGRELGRNAAMGRLALSTGLRRREFTYLLVYELPPLPARRSPVPVPFPLGRGTTKGSKPRTTWIDYEALAEAYQYIELEREAAAGGFVWRPPAKLGEPLYVEAPDWEGAKIDGRRRSWRSLSPSERLRLISPEGGSCLLALQSTGKPFTDWATVFRRTSERIRARFEPRFPIVNPHRLRHSFAMFTLEQLVKGYYQRAAALVKDTDPDAGLALYLTKHDPITVLRDLLGHTSVTTTEIYLSRMDVTRIYQDAYIRTGEDAGLLNAAGVEAMAEFDDAEDD